MWTHETMREASKTGTEGFMVWLAVDADYVIIPAKIIPDDKDMKAAQTWAKAAAAVLKESSMLAEVTDYDMMHYTAGAAPVVLKEELRLCRFLGDGSGKNAKTFRR